MAWDVVVIALVGLALALHVEVVGIRALVRNQRGEYVNPDLDLFMAMAVTFAPLAIVSFGGILGVAVYYGATGRP